MRRLFRFALIRRFISSLREEGAGTALRKARNYAIIRLNRVAPSILSGGKHGGIARNHTYLSGSWQMLAQQEALHVHAAPASLSKRRKIALVGDLNLPQCRKYRVEQLAEFWTAQGVEIDYAHYSDVARASAIMQDATHLMEYRLEAIPVTQMLRYEARRLRLPVLYDIDDPLFSIAAYETYENMKAVEADLKAHFIFAAPRYLEAMNGADIMTMSTPGLVAHCRELTQRPVHMRRNFADAATLEDGRAAMAAGKPEDGKFRLCFASGSRGHEIDFALIADAVAQFLAEDATRRLMIVGHFDDDLLPKELRGQLEQTPFADYDAYLRTLARADVAVMPLVDDLFNRCKSGVRVLDAASVGVPSIVGTVSDMAQIVRDGETGHVVAQSGWFEALDGLARDPRRCAAMGQAARADLETHWAGARPDPGDHIIDRAVLDWVKA